MPGISLHTELELLHRIGLSNREALAAATTNFSNAFGWKTGKVQQGFDADILILDKNPLDDLANTKAISVLINNGKVIDREQLLKGKMDYSDDPNGEIINRWKMDVFSDSAVMNSVNKKGTNELQDEFTYLNHVKMEELFYVSDGLKVKAYLAYPDDGQKHPAIIYNRGGNREFAKLNPKKMARLLARIASWGYVVVGSQYRGNDGGEGREEFGGKDIDDVLNLIPLLESLPNVDTNKLAIYGRSRGGMMTYLSLMKTNRFKAAVVVAGASNLQDMSDNRGNEMESWVYSELIPDYWDHKDSLLAERSAITRIDDVCKTTPILLLHGTADWRVMPEETLAMAMAFQKAKIPYRLVMFEGDDHSLTKYRLEQYVQIKQWLHKYLTQLDSLPNLTPHGK
jgi:dipeptidyl aminopeptidase/acylaminoacyl peptidase